jgi:hypothetical protein
MVAKAVERVQATQRPRITVTPETTPGNASGFRPDVKEGTYKTRQRYHGAAPFTRDRADILYNAAGIPSSQQLGAGAYGNQAGGVEFNPTDVTALNEEPTEDMLKVVKAIERFRGLNTAQEAMAGTAPFPDPSGNSLFFELGRLPSETEMGRLTGMVPGATHTAVPTTGGVMALPYAPKTSNADSMKALGDFRELARRYLGAEPQVVNNEFGFYMDDILPKEPFTGEATMRALGAFADVDPRYARDLANDPDTRRTLLDKYEIDRGAPGTREDIQNTRQFFADPRWAQAVELIRQGTAPAAALAALGYSADALAGSTQPER